MKKNIDEQIEISSKDRFIEIVTVLKNNNIINGITPSKFRKILEELGPTFVKIGQILSNRPDMISNEYIEELSKLRSNTTPMTYQEILDILRSEYNQKLFNIFFTIDRKPIGSASIAQAHRAILKDGEEVVVKVQRPNIKEKMIVDIRLLKKAVKLLHIQSIFKNVISFEDALDELLNTTLEEMDFIKESSNIEEFNIINKNISYIKIPKVYKKYTTEKVLVMSLIDGCKINDIEELKRQGINPETIGASLADNYIYQAIDMGFFHADPHPDNIKVSDGKIAYLDFGMMGRINSRNKEILEKCIIAIFNNDISEVENSLLIMSTTTGDVDHPKLRRELTLLLEKNKSLGIKDINITEFATETLRILGNNNIKLPKDITMLIRGIVVLEGTLETISPNINLMLVFKRRIKNGGLKQFINKEKITEEIMSTAKSISCLSKLPEDLHKTLDEFQKGEAKINVEVTDSSKQIDRLEKMVHRIVVCVLDVAFIIGASLMASRGINTKEQIFLFYLYLVVGFGFTVWLFIKMYIDKLNRKK